MSPTPKSWTAYRKRWVDCTACPLHATALERVIYRGPRPANILFIGEAPGPTEDLVGSPFIGPAGKLLDKCLESVRSELSARLAFHPDPLKFNPAQFTAGFANILCCFPVKDPSKFIPDTEQLDASKSVVKEGNFRAPNKVEAELCRPHLTQLIPFVQPNLIVALGRVTAALIPPTWKGKTKTIPYLEVSHPSYWMRTGGVKGLEYKKAMLSLSDFIWKEFT